MLFLKNVKKFFENVVDNSDIRYIMKARKDIDIR